MDDIEFKMTVVNDLATIKQEIKDMRLNCAAENAWMTDLDRRLHSTETSVALHAAKIQQQAGVISVAITILVELGFRLVTWLKQ